MRLPDLRIARTNEFGSSKESEMRRIKNRLAAATALLLCASCGGASDQQILEATCAESGGSKAVCSCYATKVKETLSAEDYKFFVKLTEKQASLAKKAAEMTTAEAMEAGEGAAKELLSDPERMERLAATTWAMVDCAK